MPLQDPRGDAVADVLGASLIRHALYQPLEARAPWGLRVPQRESATFYLVAKGTARLEVSAERPCVLSPGEVAFVAGGAAHVLRDSPHTSPVPICDGPYSPNLETRRIGGRGAVTTLLAGFFELTHGRKQLLLQGMPPVVVLSAHDPTRGPEIASTIRFILAESERPRPASSLVLQRLADILFVLALRGAADRVDGEPHGLAAIGDSRIYEALNLMHARVAEPWTVDALARRVGMSRSAFAALFTRLLGESPLQYLARWRIARAAELLRETDEKVETIAGRVGYESVPSFSRAFKRWQDTGPAAFRRATGKRTGPHIPGT